jgi:hypothetical protein
LPLCSSYLPLGVPNWVASTANQGGGPTAGAAEAAGAGNGEPEEAAEGWLAAGTAGTRTSGAAPEPCTSITDAGEAMSAACGATVHQRELNCGCKVSRQVR